MKQKSDKEMFDMFLKNDKKSFSMTLSNDLVEYYKELCKKFGYKMSTRINLLIYNDILLNLKKKRRG